MRQADRQTKEDCGKMKDIVAGCFSFQKTTTLARVRVFLTCFSRHP